MSFLFLSSISSAILRIDENKAYIAENEIAIAENENDIAGYQTYLYLGTHSPSKTDEFSEKFQTAIDPLPPSFFGKLCCNFFLKFMTEVSSIMAKICNINFWIENESPLPL